MVDEAKTIILCFDGTTNQYGVNNTNVAKLYSMFSKESPRKQVTYFQPGIGQYYKAGVVNPITETIAQYADWGAAWYLYQHVIDGYRFIVQNWSDGDEVFIFGFSRGAYTARCVAGMVQKVGVIAKDNDESLDAAYKLYERTDPEGNALAASFKRTFAREVPIDFVGVFDTVASVGLIIQRELPLTSNNPGVRTFRHAMALDEHRVRFQVTPFRGPTAYPGVMEAAYFPSAGPIMIPATVGAWVATVLWKAAHPTEWPFLIESLKARGEALFQSPKMRSLQGAGVPVSAVSKVLENVMQAPNDAAHISKDIVKGGTDIKEVWFAGTHNDIGGCAVPDVTPRSLGDITLRWMVKELLASSKRLVWRSGTLEDLLGPELEDAHGGGSDAGEPETPLPDLDALDATAPIHDDLDVPVWWLFEILPLSWTWQDLKGNWFRQWRFNLGRGRLFKGEPTVHHSVRQRMADPKLNYKPKAVWARKNQKWV